MNLPDHRSARKAFDLLRQATTLLKDSPITGALEEAIQWIDENHPESPEEYGERLVIFARPNKCGAVGKWVYGPAGRWLKWATKEEVSIYRALQKTL